MTEKRGIELLRDAQISKSTAFTREERIQYGLKGLLPYAVSSQETQMKRILANMERKPNNVEKHIFLSALEDRNQRIFYRLLIEEIDTLMPIIYTPTVGQVCKNFSSIFRKEKGFYITPEDKGDIANMFSCWPEEDIRIIVVTDGERILGLGDLGANGMGIPIGKLALYIAGAGIHPHQVLPVMLDVGTNNQDLLEDDIYLGYPHPRIRGEEYLELVDEFVEAVQLKYPKALIQFEDFLTPNAYKLLDKYRDKVLCFNDDIQGTASVALAGILAAQRITNYDLIEKRIMFLGAGSAATGIADLIVKAMQEKGMSLEEARANISFVDIDGLLVKGRKNLMRHNEKYAIDKPEMNFLEAIDTIQPHVLIGASGAGGTFTQAVIEKMSQYNERPVLFALSNPTWKAECTAEEAYTYSKGKAIFASGSPFDPVNYKGQRFVPGQGNNAYIFPAIGLAATICGAKTLPESVFLTAAQSLAKQATEQDLAKGKLYPSLKKLRDLTVQIAIDVVNKAVELGVATEYIPQELEEYIRNYMYDPNY